MKPREFAEIKKKYDESTERWNNLVEGQEIFVFSYVGLDIDVFRHIILNIDLQERTVDAIDHSISDKPTVTLTEFAFKTKEEANGELEFLGMGILK